MNRGMAAALAALLLAAGACPALAAPMDLAGHSAGPWLVQAYEDDDSNYCAATAIFDNGVELSFAIYQSGAFDIGLQREDWGLPDEKQHLVDLRIDGFRYEERVATSYGGDLLLVAPGDDAVQTQLRRARLLEVFSGSNAAVFSLSAMPEMMDLLDRCGAAIAAGETPLKPGEAPKQASGSAFLRLAKLAKASKTQTRRGQEIAVPEGATLGDLEGSLVDMLRAAGLDSVQKLSADSAEELFGKELPVWIDKDIGLLVLLLALPPGEEDADPGGDAYIELVESFCEGISQSSLSERQIHIRATLITGRNACEQDGELDLWQFIVVVEETATSIILLNAGIEGGEDLIAVSNHLNGQLAVLSRRITLRR
jgi:hypothetical protein